MLKRFAKGLRYYRRHALQVTACKTVVGLRVSCPPDRAWYNSRSHPHLQKFTPRRGAGVAEQGCLLSSYPGKTGIGGSNPPLSAIPIQLSSAKPSEKSLANLVANRQFYWDSLGITQCCPEK